MSVPFQTPLKSHLANGLTTVFPFDFYISSAADLVVQVDGAVQELNVDYTVTGVGVSSGGSVTLTVAPAASVLVTIYRDTPLERIDDFQTGGDLNADDLDRQLDRLWQVLQELQIGGKVSSRAIRVPAGEVVQDLPSASQRALRLLGFDASGNVTISVPADQSAAALALLLSSSALASQGAGAVGFDAARAYSIGTVGYALKNITGSTNVKRLKADLGAAGNGTTDDTATLVNAIATLPEGTALHLDGYFRITSTVTWNRRIMPICFGANEAIVVDVGTSADGVVFGYGPGALSGLNNMAIQLNVYGAASSCRYAVVCTRLDRSDVKLNIRAGATAYGLRLRGCLINNWNVQISGNYAPPATLPVTAAMPANHIAVENFGHVTGAFTTVSVAGTGGNVITWNAHGFAADQPLVFEETGTAPPTPWVRGKPYFVRNPTTNTFELSDTRGGASITSTSAISTPRMATCAPVASNTNNFVVNLEGAANGYAQVAMPGEGANTLTGEIEGLTGLPFYVESCLGFHIRDLRMEQNGVGSTIRDSLSFEIGSGVVYLGDVSHPNTITVINCRSYKIGDGYYGGLIIDNNSLGGSLGAIMTPDALTSVSVADPLAVQNSPIAVSTGTKTMLGGPGHPTMATLFVNPFCDIFDTVASTVGPPVGFSMVSYVSGDIILETGVTYDRSPSVTAAKCLSRGTTITNGAIITPGVQPWRGANEWVSIFIPIRMLSPTYRAEVYVYDGVSFNFIGQTSSSGVWEEIRGSCKLIQGNNWSIRVAIATSPGGVYTTGVQYYIGGVNVVKGPLAPSTIENSLARMNYVGTSISNTPFRQGAQAVTGGIAYYAVGNASAADWKAMT